MIHFICNLFRRKTPPAPETMIFVFGSNDQGRHAGGAARFAALHRGAQEGVAVGLVGRSYALPTVSWDVGTLSLKTVSRYVDQFLLYAENRPDLNFQVTCIGCGIAGLRHEDVAPMFADAPDNCYFDTLWDKWLPTKKKWGTF